MKHSRVSLMMRNWTAGRCTLCGRCELYCEERHDERFIGIAGKFVYRPGGISELFDNVAVFMDLRAIIEGINKNAVAV